MLPADVSASKSKTVEEAVPRAIELGTPFRDHAILQRDMELPVWGWSEVGTKITVEFSGQKVKAIATENGEWQATLQPLKTNAEPAQMRISDDHGKEVVLKDMLVGEVWLASGQSNTQWVAGRSFCNQLVKAFAEATEGQAAPIREFQVTSVVSQLHPIRKVESAWNAGGYGDYSAIAFAFAHKLYQELGVPIGLYYPNLHSLVRGWRTVWGKPELPVYFHQFYSASPCTHSRINIPPQRSRLALRLRISSPMGPCLNRIRSMVIKSS